VCVFNIIMYLVYTVVEHMYHQFGPIQEWIQALKPYCTNTQPKKPPKPAAFEALTELRSLQLKIFNAPKLLKKDAPHPYCIVSLNEVKVCRTQVKDAQDPAWDEDFMLE